MGGNGEKVLFGLFAWEKSIAHSAYRFEKHRLGGIVLYVAAETDHEIVDGACVRVLMDVPNLLQ